MKPPIAADFGRGSVPYKRVLRLQEANGSIQTIPFDSLRDLEAIAIRAEAKIVKAIVYRIDGSPDDRDPWIYEEFANARGCINVVYNRPKRTADACSR